MRTSTRQALLPFETCATVAHMVDSVDTSHVPEDRSSDPIAHLNEILHRIDAKLEDIEEQLQEIFERLNELELPYVGLRDEE